MGDFFVSLENKTKMKRFLFALVPAFVALCITGCKEDEVTAPPIAEPVDLTMTVNSTSLVMGETLEITLATTNPDETANEDFTIDLTVKDNTSGADVSTTLFEDFPASVDFSKGEPKATVTVPVKKEGIEGSHSVKLTASSRGYVIEPSEGMTITVGDYHYVTMSIENNADNTVNEGASFVLVADFGREATEDIVITVTPKEGEESNYEGLPETLTIKKGETSVKSEPVTMVKDQGKEDRTLTLTFASSVEANPVSNPTMQIKRVDMDKDLGDPLTDERWVYPSGADMAFVSEKNQAAVGSWNPTLSTKLVKTGETPHPGLSGWTFYNAMEFHFLTDMMNGATVDAPNAFGNYTPHGFANQNTTKVQAYFASDNNKFSTITNDGYCKMWAAKDETTATGGGAGVKDYGFAAFYACKFNPNNATNKPMHTRIYPGMRIEARIRVGGELNGFNPAFWFQGNSNTNGEAVTWPTCGEIDVMEIPTGPVTGKGKYWATTHTGDASGTEKPSPSLSSGGIALNVETWNIYWMEWAGDSNTITCGVNGKTTLTVTREQVENGGGIWAFDKEKNKDGLHLLLTMGAPSSWALGQTGLPSGWDSGFADITYEDSKTNPKTPRMEVDWIRFYINDDYSDEGKAHSEFLFY